MPTAWPSRTTSSGQATVTEVKNGEARPPSPSRLAGPASGETQITSGIFLRGDSVVERVVKFTGIPGGTRTGGVEESVGSPAAADSPVAGGFHGRRRILRVVADSRVACGGFTGGGGRIQWCGRMTMPRRPLPHWTRARWRRSTDLRGPVIELEHVTKVYRTGSLSVEALRGVTLSIRPAEYVAASWARRAPASRR